MVIRFFGWITSRLTFAVSKRLERAADYFELRSDRKRQARRRREALR
jgi:hypothetical protein